jgi:hypothetical protein
MYYWVGAVKWNEDHTDYTDVSDFEFKELGIKEIQLEKGDYAITTFRPQTILENEGQGIIFPPKIINFEEITIDKDMYLSFGCNEKYEI